MLALGKASGTDSGTSVSSAVVNWVLQREGIQQARVMYKRYVANFLSVELFFFYSLVSHCLKKKSLLLITFLVSSIDHPFTT